MVDSMDHRLGGRYEVRSLIGRGGMAEVHLGFDTRLSRIVAIKMLRTDLARDSVFQARFRREAQAAASLNHPNIVAVYDTGEETITAPDGRGISVPYIVMEYVEGHTVKDLLSDGTPVPINEAVEIVSGVLFALEYSHAAGLVHRDIKPGNIMLTTEGKVKVMDFGIARALTDSQATMTQPNAVVGTAQYLSPEQARGEQVDTRSDLYSTGVVLFELLTGQPPFRGDSAVAVAYQHVSAIPPTPSSITPDVPESLDRVVMKALAKNREDRYSSAADMRADLIRAARGAQVDAPATQVWAAAAVPDTATKTLQMTPPPPPQYAGAGDAEDAAGQDPSATSTLTAVDPQDDEAAQKKRKKRNTIIAVVVVALLLVGAGIAYAIHQRQTTEVAVPTDLVGLSQADATNELQGLGFQVAVGDPVADETIAKDLVSKTDPAGGSKAPKGSTVKLYLSSGSASTTVPSNLVGMTPANAKTAIENAGLVFSEASSTAASSNVAKGNVVSSDPDGGQSVPKGSTVKVTLSSGPSSVTVPDVSGKSQDEARSELENAGLKIGSTSFADDPNVDEGDVVSTDPASGTSVASGTAVNLIVSSGNVTIPDLTGQSVNEAAQTLGSLNLKVNSESKKETSTTVNPGAVTRTDPAAGQVVAPGTTVTIYVATEPSPTPTPTTPSPTPSGSTSK